MKMGTPGRKPRMLGFGGGSQGIVVFAAASSLWLGGFANAVETVQKPVSLRAGWGRTVTAVGWTAPAGGASAGATSFPYPRPRLAGYTPLVAAATSDSRLPAGAVNFEHVVHAEYTGNPLPTTLDRHVAFAILDTGADFDLFGGQSAEALGLSGDQLTTNCLPLGGVGDPIMACISNPVGVFAGPLSELDPNGTLDLGAVVGHSNVAVLAAPTILCGQTEILTGVIGMPFATFFNSIIEVDAPVTASIGGVSRTSPRVTLQEKSVPFTPLARKLLLELASPAPVTTASYFPNPFDPEFPPITPTELSGGSFTLPSGGSLLTTIRGRNGTNPDVELRMLFDSGAQVSAITPGAVVRLNLPNDPDFQVTLCGIGGTEIVDGYYVDYVRMNAQGGALEFSRAPFLVLSLESPDDGPLDGILGTNFFWDRNVILEPSLSGNGFLHLSDPVLAAADYDADGDIDLEDAAFFMNCFGGPDATELDPFCAHMDSDGNGTIDLKDFAAFHRSFCASWPAYPTCGM